MTDKLTPEELQKLRNSLKSALDEASTRADMTAYRSSTASDKAKILGGELPKTRAYLIGNDFDAKEFQDFIGDHTFTARYEITGDDKTFLSVNIDGSNFLLPGDVVFRTDSGKIFGARVS